MRKILLAEDEPVLREAYQMILATQPYASDFAENGQEAYEKFTTKDYDLLLLDVMMPAMSGIEFLEKIKDDDELLSKVVIMSNLSAGKELDRAREIGVEDILLKSDLSPKQLIERIRSYLEA